MNLKQFVNDKELWDDFLSYIDKTIAMQHKGMEQADSETVIYRLQGAITALRRLKHLKSEMNNGSK